MIKRFHEAPKSIFKQVQERTDGDYALVHLFEEDPEYYELFKCAVAAGREVILDNSIFELGEAFDGDLFAEYVKSLKPSWYVVPDVLDNAGATMARFEDFTKKYGDLPGGRIGVVQGETAAEMIDCYQFMKERCNMVAFSFDSKVYGRTWEELMHGRAKLLIGMYLKDIIDLKMPHHLLGVALPQEMSTYSGLGFVYSVDTSNPVVHGMKGILYSDAGLASKESQKLYTLINADVSELQMKAIEHNIATFRRFCYGDL